MAIVLEILKQVAHSLLIALFTRQFVEELVVKALRWLAQKSDNQLDDQLVDIIEKALKKSEENQQQ